MEEPLWESLENPLCPLKGELFALCNFKITIVINLPLFKMITPNKKLNDSTVPPPAGGGEGGIEILVFKTNLSNTKHIGKIKSSLNLHPYIKEWNVDLHDRDNILRVVSENIVAQEVEQIIVNAGYFCEELY